MWRDISAYLKAVIHHWKQLLTGSILAVVLLVLSWKGIQVSQSLGFVIIALTLHYAAFLAWREQHRRVRALTERPTLRVRFLQERPYVLDRPQFTYRVGVYNQGPGTVENVQVRLLGVTPRPRAGLFHGNFPYTMPSSNGDRTGRRINEGQEEYFTVAESWLSSDNRLIVQGIDGEDDVGIGQMRPRRLAMEHEERWHLALEVSSANTQPHIADVLLERTDKGRLSVTLAR